VKIQTARVRPERREQVLAGHALKRHAASGLPALEGKPRVKRDLRVLMPIGQVLALKMPAANVTEQGRPSGPAVRSAQREIARRAQAPAREQPQREPGREAKVVMEHVVEIDRAAPKGPVRAPQLLLAAPPAVDSRRLQRPAKLPGKATRGRRAKRETKRRNNKFEDFRA